MTDKNTPARSRETTANPYRSAGSESTPRRAPRRPVPTIVPGGSETMNAWLLEWAAERRDLEAAEAALAAETEARRKAEAERDAAGQRWPQTVATLEAALSTFPAGRIWLKQWSDAESALATATAFLRSFKTKLRASIGTEGQYLDEMVLDFERDVMAAYAALAAPRTDLPPRVLAALANPEIPAPGEAGAIAAATAWTLGTLPADQFVFDPEKIEPATTVSAAPRPESLRATSTVQGSSNSAQTPSATLEPAPPPRDPAGETGGDDGGV